VVSGRMKLDKTPPPLPLPFAGCSDRLAQRIRTGEYGVAKMESRQARQSVSGRPLSHLILSGRWRFGFALASTEIFLIAAAIRWWFFDVTEFRGDELVYLSFAKRLSTAGLTQFRTLAETYASDPSLWVYPPPLRAVYLLLAAVACRVAGDCSGTAVAAISLLSGLALVLLTLVMARRMFGEWVGLLSGLLVALSPLQLAMSRRVWADAFFSLTLLLAIWAFWERTRSPRKGWDLLLGCSLLAAILTKESAVVFYLGLLCALLFREQSPAAPIARSTLAALLLPPVLAFLTLLVLVPDPALLIRLYSGTYSATKTGEYAMSYSQGPWFRYLIDFALLSPLTTILAIGYYFTQSGKDSPFLGRCALILFMLFSLVALKNVRYVGFLDILIRILAVLSLTSLSHRPPFARLGERWLLLPVLLLAAYDLFAFYRIFIGGGVYDPVTATLARAERLIP